MRCIAVLLGLLIGPVLGGCNDGERLSAEQSPTAPIANAAPGTQEPVLPIGEGYDFYVLSLSWSPAYCAKEGGDADPRQCRAAKPFGFIVHGLWPQYEQGSPTDCGLSNLTRAEIDSVLDLTPSPGLLRHEWEKHGTCSGLSPSDYFAVMRAARERVRIPAQFGNPKQALRTSAHALEQAFVRVNPGMTAQSIAVACPQNDFSEVRICMTKSLELRACTEVDRAGCRSQSIIIQPLR